METASRHLKGLNGLRAIAAVSVVIFHTGRSLDLFGLKAQGAFDLAGFGVTIFFALSGYLITYLLLSEKEVRPLNIGHFYIRRILRIWPLYFLVLGASLITTYFCYPDEFRAVTPYYSFYLFFVPNIPFSLGINIPLLGHYWSLGVEEQFYLVWPWLIGKIKKPLKFVFSFTIIFILIRIFFRYLDYKWNYAMPYSFIHDARFDCISIGALGALFMKMKNERFIKITTHYIAQLLAWGSIILLMLNLFHIASVIDHELISILTVVLIINLSENPKTILSLENKFFDFLGKISFGMYMYHPLIIFGLAILLGPVAIPNEFKYPMVYTCVLACTIIISFLSFRFFEMPFLILKNNFTFTGSNKTK
ncbi:MAG: acyltransferase family protein [Bacteroidia bacterium]